MPPIFDTSNLRVGAQLVASAYLGNTPLAGDSGIVYDEGFALLNLATQTVVNLTDAATPTATRTKVGGALQIALSTGSRIFAWSTADVAGTSRTRIVYTANCTFASTCGVGFSLFDGVNRCAFVVSYNGRLTVVNNRSGGSVGLVSTALPTFVTGAIVEIRCVLNAATETAYLAISVNGGPPDCFGITNVPSGAVEVVQQNASTVQHSLVLSAASTIQLPGFPSALSGYPAGAVAAIVGEFLQAEKNIPTGWTRSIPTTFSNYPFSGNFFTTGDIQPVLSESDSSVTVVYVDNAAGLDSNPGTAVAPIKSLRRAAICAQSGSRIIIKAKGGLYGGDDSFGTVDIVGSVTQIVSWDGVPVVSSKHFNALSWSVYSGQTYTSTFAGGVSTVFDASSLTADGDYTQVVLETSLVNCAAVPNTYFVTGTTIYVHLFDGRSPDSDLRVYRKGIGTADDKNISFSANGQIVYLEKIHAEGGVLPLYSRAAVNTYTHAVYAKDCAFKYGASNGINETYAGFLVLQRCVAAWNTSDGFNYKSSPFGGAGPLAIEVDCIGRYNGWDSEGTNNGSTTHSAGAMIRVGGDYHHNQNRNVHDIASAESWNIGVTARNSRGPANMVNFAAGVGGADATRMWLDGCISSGSTSDIEADGVSTRVSTSSIVSGGANTGSGVIDTYIP